MKKIIAFLFLGIFLFACSPDEDKDPKKTENAGSLIETKDGIYYEYYPGKKQVKITGPVDDEGKRHGRWELFNLDGKRRGWNMYIHGKRHGHSYSEYPNGTPLYYGEYRDDKPVGIWKSYTKDGKVVTKDYGMPEGE